MFLNVMAGQQFSVVRCTPRLPNTAWRRQTVSQGEQIFSENLNVTWGQVKVAFGEWNEKKKQRESETVRERQREKERGGKELENYFYLLPLSIPRGYFSVLSATFAFPLTAALRLPASKSVGQFAFCFPVKAVQGPAVLLLLPEIFTYAQELANFIWVTTCHHILSIPRRMPFRFKISPKKGI